MKLFAKIGAVSLVGGLVVALSATGFASKQAAEDDYIAMKHAQAEARAANDIIKLNCVNDKLVQAKALLNIIDGVATPSESQSDQEKLHELRVAADGCVGSKQISSEGSTNSFEGPPGATEPNPSWNGWGTVFEPGANASKSTPN